MAKTAGFSIAGLFAFALLVPTEAPAASVPRSLPGVNSVDIDGQAVGAKVDMIDTQTASGTTTDTTLAAAFAAKTVLTTWVTDTLAGHGTTKTVVLHENIVNGKAQTDETVRNVTIKEIDLPKLDASDAHGALADWKIKLTSGASTKATGGPASLPAWSSKSLATNFRVAIDGIDGSRVVGVDPLVVNVSQGMSAAPTAAGGATRPAPLRLTPTTTVTPGSLVIHAQPGSPTVNAFSQWLANGHAPKNGTIVLLGTDLKTPVATITLTNVVVSSITSETVLSGAGSSVPSSRIALSVGGLGLTMP